MKLLGQVIGWAIVIAAVTAIMAAGVFATLPPQVHP